MITIGFCTKEHDENYNKHLLKMCGYHKKIEIIEIVNNGDRSLSECYNEILNKSKNDIILYLHNDLILLSKNIGDKLVRLFDKSPEFGIIGVAGATDLVNGTWWEMKKSAVGRVYHEKDGKRWLSKFSQDDCSDKPKEVVMVDGLFFAVHKGRIKKTFDEDFRGFHFYDLPICVLNHVEGVKIGVTTKFEIVHKSIGVTNKEWERNKLQFEDKFKDVLPLRLTEHKTLTERLNYDKDSIGVGIVTYNSPDRIKQSSITVPKWIKNFVIINDGSPYDESVYPSNAEVINHNINRGVGMAKNTAVLSLLDKGCEHIFLMEDDVLIKDENVFDQYIKTSILTGIKHLNYALQGPGNKKGYEGFNDLDDRSSMDNLTEPNPRQVMTYPDGSQIALYTNCVGAFSYYRREVFDKVGLFDTKYRNAYEHIDHTLECSKKGFGTPYWWFADINESWNYLTDLPDCMSNSTISKIPNRQQDIDRGYMYFKTKHKFFPLEVPDTSPEVLQSYLNRLFQSR